VVEADGALDPPRVCSISFSLHVAARVIGPAAAIAALTLGASAARADGAFPDGQSVLLPRDRPHEIIVAATFGLVFSEDDGATWSFACEVDATRMGRLYMVGPPPADRLFATADPGAATSGDGGCTWTLGGGALAGAAVADVFPDPTDASAVMAVAIAPGAGSQSAVYRSSDGGLTYGGPLFTPLEPATVTGVEVAASSSDRIYVTFYAYPGNHPRIARTTNGGVDWTTIDLEPQLGSAIPFLAAVDPQDPDKVYLRLTGMTDETPAQPFEALAVSADGGASWSVPVTVPGEKLTAFQRRGDGTVLVAALDTSSMTPRGFRSSDGGRTFEDWPLSIHPRGFGERDGTLFAVTDNLRDGFALAASVDGGSTWMGRMRFSDIGSIRGCVRQACLQQCVSLADAYLFPSETCDPPPDAGADHSGGPAGGGQGCGCAYGTGATASRQQGALLLGLLVTVAAAILAVRGLPARRASRGRSRGRRRSGPRSRTAAYPPDTRGMRRAEPSR
jgi:hypothetical protein